MNEIADLLEQLLADHPTLPAVAVALRHGDGSTSFVGRGVADPASGTPLTEDGAFRIASCTKSFVAATVVSLVADGLVELDAAAIDLLPPDVAAALAAWEHGRTITVRQLLQHRTGLVDHSTFPEFNRPPDTQWSAAEQLAIALAKPPLFAPGTAFSYSDSGYVLLGQLIEQQTAMPLAAAVRVRAGIDAATMPSIHWETVEPTPAGSTRVHQLYLGLDTYDWNPSLDMYGGGGLVANLPDLARWWSDWFGGTHGDIAVHLADLADTAGPAGPVFPGGDRMGLGLFGRTLEGMTVWSHGGFWGLETGHVPELGLSYALSMTNRAEGVPFPPVVANAVLGPILSAGARS